MVIYCSINISNDNFENCIFVETVMHFFPNPLMNSNSIYLKYFFFTLHLPLLINLKVSFLNKSQT